MHPTGPERALFGSDFPHPEGFENPTDFGAALEGLDRESTQMVMRDKRPGAAGKLTRAVRGSRGGSVGDR